MSFRSVLLPLLAFSALAPLGGCIPVLAGGAASAGYAATGERGIGTQINDVAIKAQIAQKWQQSNADMARQLTLDVYQGRVLVAGPVSNPEFGDVAVKLAWQVEGVKEVNADVEVANQLTFASEARDSLITSELRTKLVFDSEIRSINYNIDTVNGVVYLVGSARAQSELDRVIDYARNVAGVRRVVSYVKIRSGVGETGSGSSGSGGSGSASRRAAEPIETVPSYTPPPSGGSGGAIEAHPL